MYLNQATDIMIDEHLLGGPRKNVLVELLKSSRSKVDRLHQPSDLMQEPL